MESEPPNSEQPSPAASVLDDAQLWLAIAQGDSSALGTLYDRHAGLVYGVALKVLGNAQDAEDLTQDIFVKLPSYSYNPQRGALRTYLAIVTRSRALDRARSRQVAQRSIQKLEGDRSTVESSTGSSTPLYETMQQEQSQEVQAALGQLSESQQQILKLAYYDGLTQASIAERLGTPLGTIKTKTRRGLLKLRQILHTQSEQADRRS